MEVRKIQKTGVSTMIVSLPKEWIVSNDLKAGDQVSIESLSDGTLSIGLKTREKKEAQRRTISVAKDETADHLTRKLIGTYLAGFNVIEVRSSERMDLDIKHAIKDFARLVIGPEVIEETSNSIVLHDLSDPVELPQKKCVRRMHLIVDSMHRDAIAAVQARDAGLAKDVIDRDQDVDRLYWMAVKQYNLIQKDRSLAERIGVDIYESMSLMLVARLIERIGDHAERIAKNALLAIEERIKPEEVEEIRELSDTAIDALNETIDAFFSIDTERANAAIDQAEALAEDCEKLRKELQAFNGADAVIKTTILDSILRTAMYSTDVAEIAINEAMRLQKE